MSDESVNESQRVSANKLKAGWELLKVTLTEWSNDNAFELSAALAFYTIFSIAPVLLIAVGVASFFLAPDTATEQIVGEMGKMIGTQGANAVRQVIDSSRGFGKGLWAVSVGIVTLITGATAVFGELQSALNQIWDVKAKPDRGVIMSFIFDRLRSFSIAICVGFLLLVSLLLDAGLHALDRFLTVYIQIPSFVGPLTAVISVLVLIILFAAILKILPDVEIGWGDVWIGAIVTAILFTLGKYLIGLYLGSSSIGSSFGAAGALILILVWVYYSTTIFLFGAEFTKVYADQFGSGIHPGRNACFVDEGKRSADCPPRPSQTKE